MSQRRGPHEKRGCSVSVTIRGFGISKLGFINSEQIMLHFEHLNVSLHDWDNQLNAFSDGTIFQTAAWLRFLENTQRGEIVIAALTDNHQIFGYFCGLTVRKCGIRILGSPFHGWTTAHMGLTLSTGIPRSAALCALMEFAFDQLGCLHLELMDRHIRTEDLDGLKCDFQTYFGYEVDLTASEDVLLGRMTHQSRGCIRKATRCGVVIEVATNLSFADEYYEQLRAVYARQGLGPAYDVQRVRELIRILQPTGSLLLLRARTPEGACIATAISVGAHSAAYLWGIASYRNYHILRPNELLLWYAMRYWKRKGIRTFDMGGLGQFKKKFGGYEIAVPWLRISRSPLVAYSRVKAEAVVGWWLHSRFRLMTEGMFGRVFAAPKLSNGRWQIDKEHAGSACPLCLW